MLAIVGECIGWGRCINMYNIILFWKLNTWLLPKGVMYIVNINLNDVCNVKKKRKWFTCNPLLKEHFRAFSTKQNAPRARASNNRFVWSLTQKKKRIWKMHKQIACAVLCPFGFSLRCLFPPPQTQLRHHNKIIIMVYTQRDTGSHIIIA